MIFCIYLEVQPSTSHGKKKKKILWPWTALSNLRKYSISVVLIISLQKIPRLLIPILCLALSTQDLFREEKLHRKSRFVNNHLTWCSLLRNLFRRYLLSFITIRRHSESYRCISGYLLFTVFWPFKEQLTQQLQQQSHIFIADLTDLHFSPYNKRKYFSQSC